MVHCKPLLWVHFGTPCGTASKARSRRMSATSHGPPPLRSELFPLGLPKLPGNNLARVRSANILYSFTCKLISTLCTLERCRATPYWKRVQTSTNPFLVELHYCVFGGRRKKHTCIATNCETVLEMNVLCDGQHDHLPWAFSSGKFATSDQAEYPVGFCKELSSCVFRFLAKTYSFPDNVLLLR